MKGWREELRGYPTVCGCPRVDKADGRYTAKRGRGVVVGDGGRQPPITHFLTL